MGISTTTRSARAAGRSFCRLSGGRRATRSPRTSRFPAGTTLAMTPSSWAPRGRRRRRRGRRRGRRPSPGTASWWPASSRSWHGRTRGWTWSARLGRGGGGTPRASRCATRTGGSWWTDRTGPSPRPAPGRRCRTPNRTTSATCTPCSSEPPASWVPWRPTLRLSCTLGCPRCTDRWPISSRRSTSAQPWVRAIRRGSSERSPPPHRPRLHRPRG
mmetsp:Transcript_14487/g.46058  ORF Transcript_14487/g.46058 Transcript_14487/m.46058 type:complete len:215 (+) Transcript_14487:1290-1934(+)